MNVLHATEVNLGGAAGLAIAPQLSSTKDAQRRPRYAVRMSSPVTYAASCHCGVCQLTFTTASPPDEWPVRGCSCTFCRAHAARYTSDPNGAVTLALPARSLNRYRFASNGADFLLCRECGVFLGALTTFTDDTSAMAINLNALRDDLPLLRPTTTHEFQAEAVPERMARRKRNWTPVIG